MAMLAAPASHGAHHRRRGTDSLKSYLKEWLGGGRAGGID